VTEAVNLGVLLFVANRALEKRAHHAVVEAGGSITLAQARVAARIGPDGTRLTSLAAQAQVTKQTAAHLVNELEGSGYVERVADPDDGRARLIRLTAAAEPLVEAANAAVADELAAWRRHLGVTRMRQLEEALTMLREITDPWA
jgi:DNA-binding MarR family transcriptional regulator